MVLTPQHAYPHQPRTGGVFTRGVLLARGGHQHGAGHAPIRSLKPEHRGDRIVFGTVSSPLRWYRSIYCYAANGRLGPTKPNVLAYGRGETGFKAWLYGVTHPAEVELPALLGVIWRLQGDQEALGKELQASGLGLYSWVGAFTYGDGAGNWGVDYLIPTDRLNEGLGLVLGEDLSDLEPRNGTMRKGRFTTGEWPDELADWYDEESLGWVLGADGWLMDLMGWDRFGPADTALLDLSNQREIRWD